MRQAQPTADAAGSAAEETLQAVLDLPFGIAWFTVIVTGLSVGFGTLITLVGVPILLLLLLFSRVLSAVERARSRLLVTAVAAEESQPSRFLDDLDPIAARTAEDRPVERVHERVGHPDDEEGATEAENRTQVRPEPASDSSADLEVRPRERAGDDVLEDQHAANEARVHRH